MLKKIALFTALATMMGMTYAYKAEVGISYNEYDSDFNYGSEDEKLIRIDGTYYLKLVEVKNYPLNEAAFLNRSSNFNARINKVNNTQVYYETYPYDKYISKDKWNQFNLGIEYFAPNSNFYINANIGHGKGEDNWKRYDYGNLVDSGIPYKYTYSTYSAEVGYLPINGLLITAGLAGFTDENDYSVIDPKIRAKYVTNVGKFDANFEANARFGDDINYGFGADLYIDKTLSVGLAYSASDNSYDDDEFSIRAKKFVTPQMSVEASANMSSDADSYGLRAAYRF
ncbi:putative porin [Acinetobacter sp. 194]|uniref:putative porin n=1 Tax=Acinetobacter shaoyimingii TaxID=2715164 RepID=UPI001407C7B7|nr:putative porin [Acinetobacter shaoyimingii]NHB56860.1 putative porin [Acinetobacter shaoyimingii]